MKASKQTATQPGVALLSNGWYFGTARVAFKVVEMASNIAIGLARQTITDMKIDTSPGMWRLIF